jgi:hypothetical protein
VTDVAEQNTTKNRNHSKVIRVMITLPLNGVLNVGILCHVDLQPFRYWSKNQILSFESVCLILMSNQSLCCFLCGRLHLKVNVNAMKLLKLHLAK